MNIFRNPRFVIVLVVVALMMSAVMNVGAQLSLDLNLDPLWTSVNTYFPIFLGIVAIGGGIAIAIAIANFVIKALLGAFGKGGR